MKSVLLVFFSLIISPGVSQALKTPGKRQQYPSCVSFYKVLGFT